jgi:hypothetical protein
MVRYASKFTPEVLIEAPRRSPAIPSPDGAKALYTLSRHTIGKETVKDIRVMDISTGISLRVVLADKVHDARWLGVGHKIIYLQSAERGITIVKLADASDPSLANDFVAEIAAPVRALRVKVLDKDSVALAVAGLVGGDGELFNDEAVENKTTVRVYDKFQIRYVGRLLAYFPPGTQPLTVCPPSGTNISSLRGMPSGTLS